MNWLNRNKTWIFSGIGVALITGLISLLFSNGTNGQATNKKTMIQNGGKNIQAGRDVHITNFPISSNDGELEITDVRFTQNSEFDVLFRNIGDTAIIVKEIEVTIVNKYPYVDKPILKSTAKYSLPLTDMEEGDRYRLKISHFIDPRKADRFKIAIDSTNIYKLKVKFLYNKQETISFTKGMW